MTNQLPYITSKDVWNRIYFDGAQPGSVSLYLDHEKVLTLSVAAAEDLLDNLQIQSTWSLTRMASQVGMDVMASQVGMDV
jgi:hypothetical protein